MTEPSAMNFGHLLHRRAVRAPKATPRADRFSITALVMLTSIGALFFSPAASARVCTEAHAQVTATVGQVLLEPSRCFVMLAPNSLVRYVPDPICPLDADSIMHGEILVAFVNGVCPYQPGDLFHRRVTLNAQGFLVAN
jgi:hypothetical protein